MHASGKPVSPRDAASATVGSDLDTLRAIGERMRTARSAKGMTQADLGGRIGVSRAAISQWETGEVEATMLKLRSAADHLQASLEWILNGKGQPPQPSAKKPEGWPAAPGVVPEMACAIGAGATLADEAEAEWWRIPPHALRNLRCKPDQLKIFAVRSAEMTPTINQGSYVAVDFAQRLPHNGQVYAVSNEISLSLVRLFLKPGAKAKKLVELLTDSEPDRRAIVPLSSVKIAGRVVAEVFRAL